MSKGIDLEKFEEGLKVLKQSLGKVEKERERFMQFIKKENGSREYREKVENLIKKDSVLVETFREKSADIGDFLRTGIHAIQTQVREVRNKGVILYHEVFYRPEIYSASAILLGFDEKDPDYISRKKGLEELSKQGDSN